MRIRDWSSDVCSSDLIQQDGGAKVAVAVPPVAGAGGRAAEAHDAFPQAVELGALFGTLQALALRRRRLRFQPGLDQRVLRVDQIGSAACRERVCQYA